MAALTGQTLIDRAMISDQVYRYMKGLDTRDFDLVISVLLGRSACRRPSSALITC